jgi:hypothetical protein
MDGLMISIRSFDRRWDYRRRRWKGEPDGGVERTAQGADRAGITLRDSEHHAR